MGVRVQRVGFGLKVAKAKQPKLYSGSKNVNTKEATQALVIVTAAKPDERFLEDEDQREPSV